MPESLDIIAKIDSDPSYGPTSLFKPMSGRKDIKDWQAKAKEVNSALQRPRYMMSILPEFQQKDGKDAFVKNHPIPPYAKDEWKTTLSLEDKWSKYADSYSAGLDSVKDSSNLLKELDGLLYSTEFCTEGGLSLDDIDLWSRLRSLTIVKGIEWPEKLRTYMDYFSLVGDVPLYDSMAC